MKRPATFVLVTILLTACPLLADDNEAAAMPDPEAMMAMMEAAAKPGENHAFLSRMEGEWTFTNTMWMAPGQPPMKSEGTSSKKMIFGGRYLEENTSGEMMGMGFDGRGVTGYDNTAEGFAGTWIDSMSTMIATVKGERAGDTLTMRGEYLDPMSMQTLQVRYVTRVVSDDEHVFEYYMTMPGAPEAKSMEIVYTRK